MIKKPKSITKKEKTKDEERLDMNIGEEDKEVYTETGRQLLEEDDEIEPWEQAFMEGAKGRGQNTSCARCGKILGDDKKEVFEKKIDGKKMLFCSAEHAKKGKR